MAEHYYSTLRDLIEAVNSGIDAAVLDSTGATVMVDTRSPIVIGIDDISPRTLPVGHVIFSVEELKELLDGGTSFRYAAGESEASGAFSSKTSAVVGIQLMLNRVEEVLDYLADRTGAHEDHELDTTQAVAIRWELYTDFARLENTVPEAADYFRQSVKAAVEALDSYTAPAKDLWARAIWLRKPSDLYAKADFLGSLYTEVNGTVTAVAELPAWVSAMRSHHPQADSVRALEPHNVDLFEGIIAVFTAEKRDDAALIDALVDHLQDHPVHTGDMVDAVMRAIQRMNEQRTWTYLTKVPNVHTPNARVGSTLDRSLQEIAAGEILDTATTTDGLFVIWASPAMSLKMDMSMGSGGLGPLGITWKVTESRLSSMDTTRLLAILDGDTARLPQAVSMLDRLARAA